MKAGFARVRITPPVGTTMMGFSARDREHGCCGVHDDLFVRALYLAHQEEEVLIMGFDLCFLGREDADRCKGAIGRGMDLSPARILLNTSHTHVGPSVGTWAYADYTPPDRLYLRELELAVVDAACEARDAACEVTMWAAETRSALPMSRRRQDEDGHIIFAPNPGGIVCDSLPLCLFRNLAGEPVSLLFSVSCHPSTVSGCDISADYPGAATRRLDAYFDAEVSLFLQGAGGDAKPSVIGKDSQTWRTGTWEDVAEAGAVVAGEVILALETDLVRITPAIRTRLIDMSWPLALAVGRSGYEAILADPGADELMHLWARRQIQRLERGRALPTSVPVTCHGVQLGEGVRIIGLEGEVVAELGLLIRDFYGEGITFALGYTDGAQLYLPTSEMLREGGYEVESYFEYGHPAPLAGGLENILTETLMRMRAGGIG